MKKILIALKIFGFIIYSQISTIFSQTLIVDFGSNQSLNSFGLSGWNNLLLSPNMSYTSAGNGGVVLSNNLDEFSDFMGVKGTPKKFNLGERIVVTWYNNSDNQISFTSRISFTDQNNPSENSSDGNWYTMRSFVDYRITYTIIQPRSYAKTVFNITNYGVHKTDETFSLININLNIEWFDSASKQYLVCDKIEILNDADISPPQKPTSLVATTLSDTNIKLDWNVPSDNTSVVEYLIYNGNEIEAYTRENNFVVSLLEPNTNYNFRVSALDKCQNESPKSDAVSAKTYSFEGNVAIINPEWIEYIGAIKLPELFAYGGDGLAYNPNGDGGMTGSGAVDGYPGSLFITDINTPDRGFVAEVSIPLPKKSAAKNIEEINEVQILQTPVNIRPANVQNWSFVDVWLTGLEYLEEDNRLYNSWAIYYDVIGDKTASISCIDAANLTNGNRFGAWFLGSSSTSTLPVDPYLNDYLFSIPRLWADVNTNGRSLLNGRYREGGLSGLGPTLYAVNLIPKTPPEPNSELPFSTLLQYGSVEGTNNYNFPNSISRYNHADWWKDADWISVGNRATVGIIGNKALGNNWYGYWGENMRHDWVIADQPYPEFVVSDPNGKGWKSHNLIPMILFFDPSDLAQVAKGIKQAYEPQPYCVLRLDKDIFWSQQKLIYSAAYDQHNNLLFITEFNAPSDGRLLIHVFKCIITNVEELDEIPSEFKLEQNYPNPFNPITTIKYHLPIGTNVTLKIFDLLGREVFEIPTKYHNPGIYEEQLSFSDNQLSSGIYFCKLSSDRYSGIIKLLFMK